MFRDSMKRMPVARIILVIWLIFSIAYVAVGEYGRLKVFVYSRGRTDAVNQVIDLAKKCQPFPVNVGDNRVTLISVECLQKANESAKAPDAPKK